MSGKAYALREMKVIVEYIAEHKAYGEVKGRKMWKELADSNVTTRTWQSLKETFLKRILPDINNPYYKLSPEQMASFKQGYDIAERLNNKLEIRRDSASSNNEDVNKNKDVPVTDKKSEDNNQEDIEDAGEDPRQSDLRASTETLVLANCLDNTDDKLDESPAKSLRDLITYSEPLTPMIQAVMDDFATDEGEGSFDEARMQIVEQSEPGVNNDNEGKKDKQDESIKPVDVTENPSEDTAPIASQNPTPEPENVETNNLNTNIVENGVGKDDEVIVLSETEDTSNDNGKESTKVNKPETLIVVTQSSNTTTDTTLPGNQEAFKEGSQTKLDTNKLAANKQDSKRAQKRALSEDVQPIGIKRQNKDKQALSDTDTFTNIQTEVKSKLKSKNVSKENIQTTNNDAPINNSDSHITVKEPTEKKSEEVPKEVSEENVMNTQEIENPCLKSVSLYEEQFSNTKYTDSETSNHEDGTKTKEPKEVKKPDDTKTAEAGASTAKKSIVKEQVVKSTVKTELVKDVLILKSHSDSDTDFEQPKNRGRAQRQRDKALANMFGFSSGAVSKSRKKRSSYRRHSRSRNRSININSDSSEWTSETGSEYVSPPRGRKNKQTRKYLKPKSTRILSLQEEGGLFVMHGKKIYPVVKDGKIIKNYVTYSPEDDTEESFWKLKYVEEKKRTAELTKLLQQIKDKPEQEETRIPILPTTSGIKTLAESPKKTNPVPSEKVLPIKEAEDVPQREEGKTVKIKFTKNNEEVQLEGHWTHVNPVLAQVMQLFQKDPELTAKPQKESSNQQIQLKSSTDNEKTNNLQEETKVENIKSVGSSRKSTPDVIFDEAVQDKVDQMERAIFKEIEEREKEKSLTPRETTPQVENVTKRKIGRAVKTPKTPTKEETEQTSPAKKPKLEDKAKTENDSVLTTTVRRSTRTPKKADTDKPVENPVKTRATRKSKEVKDSQENVRYKFPSPPSTKKTNKVVKNTRQRKSSSLTDVNINSVQENLSSNSIESSLGYQDSDESPINLHLRKKKRNFTVQARRSGSLTRYRKKACPYMTDDLSSDSSNSFQGLNSRTLTFQNSSLKSDVYKSESYQLLMNKNVTIRSKNSSKLEKIEEASPISELQYLSDQLCEELNNDLEDGESSHNGCSSNVTLPTSPALSIVENISVNKSMLCNSDNFSFEKKLLPSTDCGQIMLNKLLKSDEDVSMPLMERECSIETSVQNGIEFHYNMTLPKTFTNVSDSLLKKINTVNIEDPTITESMHNKLRDLILESAKKMEVDRVVEKEEIDGKVETKAVKSKKRSSTPRKRQSTRQSKLTNTEPCIEEEHMETCSYTGRKSCPPVLQIVQNIDMISSDNNNIQIIDPNNNKPRSRKKKDIIKVKITKPKQRKLTNISEENIKSKKNKTNQTDSGINETESSIFLPNFNDSVDLIHNHSETCLNANECLGDNSVEIVKSSTTSRISVNSDSSHFDTDLSKENFGSIPDDLIQELFSCDAQDVSVLQKVKRNVSDYKTTESNCATVYHTPLGSPDSLITEDLSDEIPEKVPRLSKWHLLSEDEVSNTNMFDNNYNSLGYGANLNQIFPITCAIPDLSTITELSKDNESTRKLTDDTNTKNDIDSQSLFNF